MWTPDHIALIAALGLRAAADQFRLEQAVRGLDSLAEVDLHPILADAFAASEFGAFREQPYPGEAGSRPRHAARERCDLVLTSGPPLIDPVSTLKELDAAEGTLFAQAAPSMLESRTGADPADAIWIEVKSVAQHCYTRGIPGPNRAYASELLTIARSDIPKLSKDPVIRFSAVLVILFSESEAIARHDLSAFIHRCLDHDLPIAEPAFEGFAIPDIVGNAWCAVAVVPVRPRSD